MKNHFIVSLKITIVTLILFGILYPLAITGFAKLVGPNGGHGAQIVVDGKIVGFELIGQRFDDDNYFYSRPSAVDYNAASTGGSNKGPTNPDYLQQVQARLDTFLVHNPGIKKSEIPVDLITASGGGLDPHISPQAARVQVKRIAMVRKLDIKQVENLVNAYIQEPIVGPATVHVLRLNIALDALTKSNLK